MPRTAASLWEQDEIHFTAKGSDMLGQLLSRHIAALMPLGQTAISPRWPSPQPTGHARSKSPLMRSQSPVMRSRSPQVRLGQENYSAERTLGARATDRSNARARALSEGAATFRVRERSQARMPRTLDVEAGDQPQLPGKHQVNERAAVELQRKSRACILKREVAVRKLQPTEQAPRAVTANPIVTMAARKQVKPVGCVFTGAVLAVH